MLLTCLGVPSRSCHSFLAFVASVAVAVAVAVIAAVAGAAAAAVAAAAITSAVALYAASCLADKDVELEQPTYASSFRAPLAGSYPLCHA